MSEIKYPITVNAVKFNSEETYLSKRYGRECCGQMVAIRPCAESYENKTFLGVLLGDIAVSQGIVWDDAEGVLTVYKTMHNPAIFIPEKNAVVFGYESWWGPIKDEAHLRKITDEDIQNVWYVKALKQLTEKQPQSEEVTAGKGPRTKPPRREDATNKPGAGLYRKDKGMNLEEKWIEYRTEQEHRFADGGQIEKLFCEALQRAFYAGAEAALDGLPEEELADSPWQNTEFSKIRAEIDHFKSRPGAK